FREVTELNSVMRVSKGPVSFQVVSLLTLASERYVSLRIKTPVFQYNESVSVRLLHENDKPLALDRADAISIREPALYNQYCKIRFAIAVEVAFDQIRRGGAPIA